MRVADQKARTLRELFLTMDSFEYELAKEWYLMEPFGGERRQMAEATAVIFNTAAGRTEKSPVGKPEWWVFPPPLEQPKQETKQAEQSPEAHEIMAKQLLMALGGGSQANG